MKGFTNLQILDHKQGRFGNQLFRVATIIGQSLKYNSNYYIPEEWEHSKLFPKLKNVLKSSEIRPYVNLSHKEPKFGYHDIPFRNNLVEIQGYFQSWKFFENCFENVINDLSFDEKLVSDVKKKIKNDTSKICVHIRWGDPYDRKVGGGHKGIEDKHPVMTLDYYMNSIKYILERKKIEEIHIFTDNTDTKDFIVGKFDSFGIPIVYVDYSSDFITDFILQTLCDHFVIANSTFSYWSSFLSTKNKEKIVCCPMENEWFGISYTHLDTSSLLPNSWIKIKQN